MSVTLQAGRTATDPLEVSECERALSAELARPGCSAASLAGRLQDLGFPPLEPAWELLWSAERPGATAAAFAGARVSHLEVLERLALAAPAAGLRRSLAGRIAGDPDAQQVLWIAGFLGEHGAWREVDLALGLTRLDATWLGLDPAQVHDAVAAALAAMLARDAGAHAALRSMAETAPETFGPVALEAWTRSAGARTLASLCALLDGHRLDAVLVAQAIEAVGRRSLPPFDAFLLQRLRELAVDDDPRKRAAALRACAALGDEDSVELQIAALRYHDGGVRSAGAAALTELTGLRFGGDAQRWLSWHAGESAWWDGAGPEALERLQDEDGAVVVAALSEIVSHRLHRARSARAVAGLLAAESAELRRLACVSIGELGGRAVAPALIERLADVDGGVRDGARRSLTGLFGVELPPDVDAWKSQLERSDLAPR